MKTKQNKNQECKNCDMFETVNLKNCPVRVCTMSGCEVSENFVCEYFEQKESNFETIECEID
jgi:hypothetical protein